MGGAADLPQRSSSPLKRRASDLDAETTSSQKDDVDMIQVPSGTTNSPEASEPTDQSARSRRAQSIDMLKEENEENEDNVENHEPLQVLSTGSQDEIPVVVNEKEGIPSIESQIRTVTTLIEALGQEQLKDGAQAWLVSRAWLARVIARGPEGLKHNKTAPEGEIGPVDNSDIIQQIIKDSDGNNFVQLKHGLGSESFELFSKDAWDLVVQWYGLMPGSIPIVRYAHNTNTDPYGIPNIVFEYHPPILTIHRLWSDHSNTLSQIIKAQKPPVPIFVVSRSDRYMDFLKRIKLKAGIDMNKKVRVWRVPKSQPASEPVGLSASVNTSTPPSSRPSSPSLGVAVQGSRELQDSWTTLLLDVTTFSQLKKGDGRELIDIDDHTGNANYNGKRDLSFAGLGDNQAVVLDEQIDQNSWVSNFVPKGQKTTAARSSTSYIPNSQSNSGRNSPAPHHNTRSRVQKSGRTQGCVGLSNLGNTCYMNSALQCVRSVEELTKYFLTGVGGEELNSDNPLGNGGDVATAYESLLREMYRDPPPTSVAPRQFKNTIGKYAPSFSGYAQQDSQEFLGFLLDGLQEDLSRVKKKPYIEKPDSTDEMVNDPAAIREMAAKVWDITKKRDDSVIADLFTGMYKSTLVCPVCSKVSITFDPFNNLTLQLPIENNWSHPIYYFPLNDKPLMFTVDMDKQGSILALKQYMSKKVGVEVDRLFIAEEFKNKFFKIHDDWEQAADAITSNDNIMMFELESKPTNWPAPRKPAKSKKTKSMLNFGNTYNNDSDDDEIPPWNDPLAERLLVPVFHRRPNLDRGRYKSSSWVITPIPHYIIVTPDEARSEDIIRRKVLEKVATLTTHSNFEEDEEGDSSTTGSIDPELVLANGSDSSGDSKIAANSIDGEDSIVDVTMKESSGDSAGGSETSISQPSDILKPMFRTRRPKFIDAGSYLEPNLQNMFSLGYFKTNKEFIPTGWTELGDDKEYPTLASRSPQLQQTPVEDSGTDFEMANGRTESESSNEDDHRSQATFGTTTRMNEESSEDELAKPVPQVLPLRTTVSRRGARKIKTYSKKGNKQARNSAAVSNVDEESTDDGPLIRLGEGIVVDWTDGAWNAMFEGEKGDNMRGIPTYAQIQTFDDTELAARRAARTKRRKNGITLDDCLNEFGKEEILSEADTWYCPRCKEHRRATKKFELWKTPDILVMHLKRFSSSGWRRDKLDVLVDFPIEGLDLSSRVVETEPGKTEIYDLFAVDDHWGGLGGGHYTAFAKSFFDHEWYEYNDSSVSKQKDPSRVVTSSAYLLFYRRRSDHPLGGPKFQQIIDTYDHPRTSSEDEQAESGEDKSLAANSSLHGSSSALTGVGAALRPTNGSGSTGQMTTVNPQDLDGLPAYQAHEAIDSDAAMNDGIAVPSIEDDSTISKSQPLTAAALNGNWDFSRLPSNRNNYISGAGSEIDNDDAQDLDFDPDGSHIVEDASSASSGSRRGRLEDFDNAIAEDDEGVFLDDNPVPDLLDDGRLDPLAIHRQYMMNERAEFKIPAEQDDDIEEPATEIHIEEGEGLKLD